MPRFGLAINASNVTQSAAFFCEVLGYEVQTSVGDWYRSLARSDMQQMAIDFVQKDHESLLKRQFQDPAGFLLAYIVEDIQQMYKKIEDLGVPILTNILREPWGQTRFQIEAPDGLIIELIELVPPDPEWLKAQGLDA